MSNGVRKYLFKDFAAAAASEKKNLHILPSNYNCLILGLKTLKP